MANKHKPVIPKGKSPPPKKSRPDKTYYGNQPPSGKPDNGHQYKSPQECVRQADASWCSHLTGCPGCAGTGLLETKTGKQPCPACKGSGVAQVSIGTKPASGI